MKKITFTLLALVCALSCAFGLIACNESNRKTVKDEKEWKQCIADARQSDKVEFSAQYSVSGSDNPVRFKVKTAGNVQYFESGDLKYYYDGEYVYEDVSAQDLGYRWKKYRANKEEGSEFVEPKNYIDKIYSGELLGELGELLGVDLTFDGLDEISNRYADAKVMEVDGIVSGYRIEENNGMFDNRTYQVYFSINRKYTSLGFNADAVIPYGDADSVGFFKTVNVHVEHEMGNPAMSLSVPTESVKEITA